MTITCKIHARRNCPSLKASGALCVHGMGNYALGGKQCCKVFVWFVHCVIIMAATKAGEPVVALTLVVFVIEPRSLRHGCGSCIGSITTVWV